MKKYFAAAALSSAVLFALCAKADDHELMDDVSRSELFQYAVSLEPGIAPAIPDRFALPDDTKSKPDWVFGIDVSHYDGKVNWSLVPSQAVTFVYVKATQGATGYDGSFATNWAALEKQNNQPKLYRGAYHFLSADTDALAQAENFLKVAGPAAPGDLPPCLDLEWDIARGSSQDRFSKYTAQQIVAKAKTWLLAVERASAGHKPLIYTNKSFWLQHGLDKADGLEGYPIWIADYGRKSLLNDTPKAPPGFEVPLWQFSEKGRFSQTGIASTNVDVSLFKGSRAEFAAKFSLPN